MCRPREQKTLRIRSNFDRRPGLSPRGGRFSGGNKYLFPGVSGPEVLNFFHWLAAIITNPKIIGHKWTAVRKVIDRAGAAVTIPSKPCMVVTHQGLKGLFTGTPESAWDEAPTFSADSHRIP